MDTLFIIWICIIVGFLIIEILTTSFFSICFSIAAIPALILNVLGFDLLMQLLAYAITLAITIYFLIPFLRKIAKLKVDPTHHFAKTNLDLIIGTTGLCLEEITFTKDGVVKVGGKEWTAKVKEDVIISANDVVKVVEIEGSKIIVKKKEGE